MMELVQPDCKDANRPFWNVGDEDNTDLVQLLQLLVKVIPVAYIFRCKADHAQIRLIIVTDQHEYQASEKTRALLDFIKMGHANLHLLYFCYGTMLDYLQRGHLFFSINCISSNCIYRRLGLWNLNGDIDVNLAKLKEEASTIFNLEVEKVSDFYIGAELFYKDHKFNMATFMLHQTCEQLYRLIILIFRNKDFKSHQLPLLRKEAVFYYPEIYNIFHVKESKELKWINILQESYLGTRYQNNYVVKEKDCVFLKEKIESMMLKVRGDLLQLLV